jgi:hypothetical protein
MLNKNLVWCASGTVIAVLTLAFFIQPRISTGVQAKDVLEQAQSNLILPGPNQVIHYSYKLYRRVPPVTLEPSDPYHKPYNELWSETQFEDSWIQVGSTGQVERWRVQLRNADGTLIQDLMFDGSHEVDYFLEEGRAEKYPADSSIFRDNRIALVEDFLNKNGLFRKEGLGLEGQSVISVYTEPITIEASQNIDEALLSLLSPFVADLQPTSRQERIDFDPNTIMPVGLATVVLDDIGNEHIISYRTLSEPEMIPTSSDQLDGIFTQTIPEDAFKQEHDFSTGTNTVTDIKLIAEAFEVPFYVSDNSNDEIELVNSSFVLNQTAGEIPLFIQGISNALKSGIVAQSTYANENNKAQISIFQGPTDKFTHMLEEAAPSWTYAEHEKIEIGTSAYSTWKMNDAQTGKRIYVVDTGQTLLYIEATSMEPEQVEDFLKTLKVFN